MAEYYWVKQGENQRGPYTLGQLQQMWGQGLITADSYFLGQGESNWLPISELQLDSVPASVSSKSRLTVLALCLLSLFLGPLIGCLGFHAFYAGRRIQGVSYVVMKLLGVLAFLGLSQIGNRIEWLRVAFIAIAYTFLFLPLLLNLRDLIWIAMGHYRDGNGLKIKK
ncbi:MAG: hypothetical protein OHK0012_08820 [Synechococcales cyanobacterium]